MRLDRELTCAEVVELVTSYLDDVLSARDRERFEEHLVFCDGCDNYLEQMRRTVQLTGRLREGDIPPALRERLLETFRSWHAA
jgi:anti-sigma factor RsiW